MIPQIIFLFIFYMPKNKTKKRSLKGGSSSLSQSTTATSTRTLKGILTSASKSLTSKLKSKRVTHSACASQIQKLEENFRMINRAYSKISGTRGLTLEQKNNLNDVVFNVVLRLKCLILRFILLYHNQHQYLFQKPLKLEGSEGDNLREYLSVIDTLKKQLKMVDFDLDLRLIKDCMGFYDKIDISTRTARLSTQQPDVLGKRSFMRLLKKIFNLSDEDIVQLKPESFSAFLACQINSISSFKIINQKYELKSTAEIAKRLPSVPQSAPVSVSETTTAGKRRRKIKRKSRRKKAKTN
jgi:hypothetical protein